jgi:hypothetical protein
MTATWPKEQTAARITAAVMTKEIAVEPVEGVVNDRIDEPSPGLSSSVTLSS